MNNNKNIFGLKKVFILLSLSLLLISCGEDKSIELKEDSKKTIKVQTEEEAIKKIEQKEIIEDFENLKNKAKEASAEKIIESEVKTEDVKIKTVKAEDVKIENTSTEDEVKELTEENEEVINDLINELFNSEEKINSIEKEVKNDK